jgi:hypothetical protein
MPAREVPEKFLVAFSLAGEQREYVRAVAEAVEVHLGRGTVFLDEWFEHYLAGDDADLKLQDIYGRRCELAVVCISAQYGSKPWTKAEHRAIRARFMRCSQSANSAEQNSILPIRTGAGDVEGILFNAIVPDVQNRSASDSAELVIARLNLVRPDLNKRSAAPDVAFWHEKPPALTWPMADHSGAREAFGELMTARFPWRLLRIQGATEIGKSHVTRQMLANTLAIPHIACGRFDFKGTTGMDRELRAFVQDLEVPPPTGNSLHDCLDQILFVLKQRARPTLLIFDTYESAGDAREWVERTLLQSLIRAEWLRVVIAGQQVPDSTRAVWGAVARPTLLLAHPPPADWFDYAKLHRTDLTFADVETACRLASDKAGLLAQMLGPK